MSKMPWVRFFPSDWLGGTRGMSAVETGVYITLIATMYERGEPITEDHSRLSRLCGASNSAFKKALETLIEEGKISRTNDGLWNERVEKEQVYLSEKSEVGSRAANARWSKKASQNNGEPDADAMRPQSQGNANQKPEAREESSSLRSEEPRVRPDAQNGFADFWKVYPHKVGKPVAEKSFAKALRRADLGTIMAGLSAYVAKTDDRPWCNPSTWLNQDRWNDAPSIHPQRRSQAPPPSRETEFARHQRECTEALERRVLGEKRNDEFASNGPAFDLEPRDWRPH